MLGIRMTDGLTVLLCPDCIAVPQVYGFGSISVILDNASSSIRALVRDHWAPVSLETLLDMQQKKQ